VFSYFVPRETPEPRAATSSFAGAETAEQAAELRDAVLWHNCVVIFVSQKPLTIFASIFAERPVVSGEFQAFGVDIQ